MQISVIFFSLSFVVFFLDFQSRVESIFKRFSPDGEI